MATSREQIELIQRLSREEGIRQPSACDWLSDHDRLEKATSDRVAAAKRLNDSIRLCRQPL